MRSQVILAHAAIGSLLAFSGRAEAQSLVFTDQTTGAGLICIHASDPSSAPQAMASGGACGDFDGDGWQDLFVLGGYGTVGARDHLFINNRNGTFTEAAAAWGVARSHRGLGIAVGDYDGDGRLDIFVATEGGPGGYPLNSLYRNNGNGTFTDRAAAAGVSTSPGSQYGGGWGAAWGDYDLDGDLDLAVGDWLSPATGNVLYRNNGDGTFTDVTAAAVGSALVTCQGFSPRFADMNGDRRPELLWTSDFGQSCYLVNNGNGTFTNATTTAGVGLDGNGMGTSIADLNGDGRPDWFVTSIWSPSPQPNQPGTGNMLYMNLGGHHFAEASQAAGVKQGGWGWGSVAVDLDNDGRTDLAHTNGFPGPEFGSDLTRVFRNQTTPWGGVAPVGFEQISPSCGVTHTGEGRGMLNFDYDNDGDQDLVIFTNDGPLTLYRNDGTGTGSHWLRVFLNTRATPGLAPDGYGAHVIATVAGVSHHAWIFGGSNYQSQSELSVQFGLSSSTVIDELRVEWADAGGRFSTWTNVAVDRTIVASSCPADFNLDGTASVQDLFDLLGAYFSGMPAADINLSGTVSVQDIFDFLSAWFSGCN